MEKLKIEPCAVWPDNLNRCHAVPLDPVLKEYDRDLKAGDICISSDEYSKAQKYIKELLKLCGGDCE
jgi:hypothetical protein